MNQSCYLCYSICGCAENHAERSLVPVKVHFPANPSYQWFKTSQPNRLMDSCQASSVAWKLRSN